MRAADEEPANGEAVVGPAAAPCLGAGDEVVAPGLVASPPLLLQPRVFLVGTLPETSTNGYGVRGLTPSPSAGETSDTLRFFATLGAANNRTSPARTSSSNP